MPHRLPVVLLCLLGPLGLVGAACSSGGSGSAATSTDTPAPTETDATPPTTSPFDVVVADDRVRVRTVGIFSTDGTQLLGLTGAEKSCVDATVATVADLSATLQSDPRSPDDPDQEQTLAEIVVGCVAFDRLQPVVADELAAQSAVASVDRACLDGEVASLQDTPDVLAAVLRGDPDALSVIAGTVAVNCG